MEGIHKYLCHTIPALLIVTGLVNAQSLERRPGLNENFVSFTEEKYEFPAPPCHEGNLSLPLGRVEAFVADSFADDVLHRYSIEGSMNYDINRITGEITAAVANPAPAAAQQAEEFLVRVHILYFATYNPTETAHISALRNRSGRVVVSVATHKVLAEQTAVVVMTCDNFQSSRPTAQLRGLEDLSGLEVEGEPVVKETAEVSLNEEISFFGSLSQALLRAGVALQSAVVGEEVVSDGENSTVLVNETVLSDGAVIDEEVDGLGVVSEEEILNGTVVGDEVYLNSTDLEEGLNETVLEERIGESLNETVSLSVNESSLSVDEAYTEIEDLLESIQLQAENALGELAADLASNELDETISELQLNATDDEEVQNETISSESTSQTVLSNGNIEISVSTNQNAQPVVISSPEQLKTGSPDNLVVLVLPNESNVAQVGDIEDDVEELPTVDTVIDVIRQEAELEKQMIIDEINDAVREEVNELISNEYLSLEEQPGAVGAEIDLDNLFLENNQPIPAVSGRVGISVTEGGDSLNIEPVSSDDQLPVTANDPETEILIGSASEQVEQQIGSDDQILIPEAIEGQISVNESAADRETEDEPTVMEPLDENSTFIDHGGLSKDKVDEVIDSLETTQNVLEESGSIEPVELNIEGPAESTQIVVLASNTEISTDNAEPGTDTITITTETSNEGSVAVAGAFREAKIIQPNSADNILQPQTVDQAILNAEETLRQTGPTITITISGENSVPNNAELSSVSEGDEIVGSEPVLVLEPELPVQSTFDENPILNIPGAVLISEETSLLGDSNSEFVIEEVPLSEVIISEDQTATAVRIEPIIVGASGQSDEAETVLELQQTESTEAEIDTTGEDDSLIIIQAETEPKIEATEATIEHNYEMSMEVQSKPVITVSFGNLESVRGTETESEASQEIGSLRTARFLGAEAHIANEEAEQTNEANSEMSMVADPKPTTIATFDEVQPISDTVNDSVLVADSDTNQPILPINDEESEILAEAVVNETTVINAADVEEAVPVPTEELVAVDPTEAVNTPIEAGDTEQSLVVEENNNSQGNTKIIIIKTNLNSGSVGGEQLREIIKKAIHEDTDGIEEVQETVQVVPEEQVSLVIPQSNETVISTDDESVEINPNSSDEANQTVTHSIIEPVELGSFAIVSTSETNQTDLANEIMSEPPAHEDVLVLPGVSPIILMNTLPENVTQEPAIDPEVEAGVIEEEEIIEPEEELNNTTSSIQNVTQEPDIDPEVEAGVIEEEEIIEPEEELKNTTSSITIEGESSNISFLFGSLISDAASAIFGSEVSESNAREERSENDASLVLGSETIISNNVALNETILSEDEIALNNTESDDLINEDELIEEIEITTAENSTQSEQTIEEAENDASLVLDTETTISDNATLNETILSEDDIALNNEESEDLINEDELIEEIEITLADNSTIDSNETYTETEPKRPESENESDDISVSNVQIFVVNNEQAVQFAAIAV